MTETQPPCRICHKPFHEITMGEKNGFRFVACASCGSVTTDPWPTQEDIDNFFGEIQPEAVHLPRPEKEIADVRKTLVKIAGPEAAGRRFLNISCRQGYAVVAAQKAGYKAKGIDTHGFFIDFAKDRYDPALFERAGAAEYAAKGEQADIIYAVESFCEQIDPEAHMAAMAKILAPKGIIYLQEPDGNSFHLPRNFANWPFADPPLNFCYISEKGMHAMLARHGLAVRKKFFTWSPAMRLVIGRAPGKKKD